MGFQFVYTHTQSDRDIHTQRQTETQREREKKMGMRRRRERRRRRRRGEKERRGEERGEGRESEMLLYLVVGSSLERHNCHWLENDAEQGLVGLLRIKILCVPHFFDYRKQPSFSLHGLP